MYSWTIEHRTEAGAILFHKVVFSSHVAVMLATLQVEKLKIGETISIIKG